MITQAWFLPSDLTLSARLNHACGRYELDKFLAVVVHTRATTNGEQRQLTTTSGRADLCTPGRGLGHSLSSPTFSPLSS